MAFAKGDDAFVLELLQDLGPITNRPMFGCGALYSEGLLFGLVDDGVFYVRADDEVVEHREGRLRDAAALPVPADVADHRPTAVVELDPERDLVAARRVDLVRLARERAERLQPSAVRLPCVVEDDLLVELFHRVDAHRTPF